MRIGGGGVLELSQGSKVDGGFRNLRFFREGVCQQRNGLAMEKIQDQVVHATIPRTEFVDAVAEDVGSRPTQFMAILLEVTDEGSALLVGRLVLGAKLQ